LDQFDRRYKIPLRYEDLHDYTESFPLYDSQGKDTLWSTLCYRPDHRQYLNSALVQLYAQLKAGGHTSHLKHLEVDRIDLCLYANTQPFRVRMINKMNDNFDYFYIKRADLSRIAGLELEHILSPNRISFLCEDDTLVEEHIYGIPGDSFLDRKLSQTPTNRVRLAKEFVKFNERCLIRLLGDMHAANFVIDITMDFEENFYRVRAIDFDQQSYEGKIKVYRPQFFKQNLPFVQLVLAQLSRESITQYQHEEQVLLLRRSRSAVFRLDEFFNHLRDAELAPWEHVAALREQLAQYYQYDRFLRCQSMMAMVATSLQYLEERGVVSER
ncbi:MAG: hypothetical protein ACOVS5_15160, partial [Oligoflexus sp.]